MEENKENILGRKVFFVNPAYSIKKDIIPVLQKQEFEVYTIDSYRDVKNLMKINQGSVLFLNVDTQLSVGSWFNYIRTFEREEYLTTISLAVITERMKQQDIDVYTKNAHLKGGIIDFSEGIDEVLKRILGILESVDAKGRRQYVRANVGGDKEASLFWNYNGKMHHLKLLDISSVGMAVSVPAALAEQIVAKNFLLQDVTMRLGVKQIPIDAVIYAIKKTESGYIWVLLLLPNASTQSRNEIRSYVAETNQTELMLSINNLRQDDTDYNLLNYYNLATKHKLNTTISPFSSLPGHNA